MSPEERDSGAAASRPSGRTPAAERKARAGSIAQVISIVLCVAAITAYVLLGARRKAPPQAQVLPEPAVVAKAAEVKSDPIFMAKPNPAPAPTQPVAPPQIDREAVSQAEALLDAASRDRARADDRAALVARRLSHAASQAAVDAARARKLAFLVRDPSTRVTQASTRGGFLKGEREKIQKELSSLRQLPRPKSASILSKAPVAKPAQSSEFHFELRRNRISFINLDRLMELTRADAQVRIRMSDRSPVISNKVGPVGVFSLEYELVRSVPGSMEELLARKNVRFELSGWELLPESENRGETYEATRGPLSEFSRAINRLSPDRSTITLWVYPDSFTLFRQIRNELTEHGFSVAARPLPAGMTIRGSPMGTQSAAQ
jgi:hypothetical protein